MNTFLKKSYASDEESDFSITIIVSINHIIFMRLKSDWIQWNPQLIIHIYNSWHRVFISSSIQGRAIAIISNDFASWFVRVFFHCAFHENSFTCSLNIEALGSRLNIHLINDGISTHEVLIKSWKCVTLIIARWHRLQIKIQTCPFDPRVDSKRMKVQ